MTVYKVIGFATRRQEISSIKHHLKGLSRTAVPVFGTDEVLTKNAPVFYQPVNMYKYTDYG